MKHLTRLLMLTALIIFVSCQNENLTEEQSVEDQETLSPDSDFEVAESAEGSLQLNEESEKLVTRPKSSLFAKSSCTPDIEGLVASLPEKVSLTTTANPAENSYFLLDIHDTNLKGTDLEAWCVDVDLDLGVEGPIEFSVLSSYGDLPADRFENPQNFDLVNWIINQDFIGSDSPSGGQYNFGHVQWAIWELIDDRNCQKCTYITNPIGTWKEDPLNVTKGQEIVDAAKANGEGYVPGCGELFAIVLMPESEQSIIITKEVPSVEEECSDCEGKVTELELEFDWHYSKRVKVYQKKENSCWGAKIFDKVLQPGEKFTLNGVNSDGSFGNYIYIYIGNRCYYYTKIKTNCYLKIGPGYERGVFNVVSGRSSKGGELCEYVKPEYNCWKYRHWSSYYYYKYRYQNHGY